MQNLLRKIYCLSALICLLVAFVGCAQAASRPNVLLILADDLGNNDIASWGDGQAPTPTLDSLSGQAVRFRQHYTDSTCSASRAALLSGREPVSVGFQPTGPGLSADLLMLPEALQGLGYRTMHLGKWHVGEALEYRQIQPAAQGFDYWLGYLNHFSLRGLDPDGQHARQRPSHTAPWLQENGQPPVQYQGNVDDLLTDKAIELMGASGQQQPWFINLWLFAPHTPYEPSPAFREQFPDTSNGRFLAVLKQLDHNVDKLLIALKERGLDKNTVVVFASDNGGPNRTRDNNYPFAGKKFTYREGGVRAPLLVYWPGHYENEDVLEVSTLQDIYPTLVALAGGEPPNGLDGRNLKSLLGGGTAERSPAHLFWAAEGGPLGMIYGLHDLAARQTYSRDLRGTFLAEPMSPPVGREKPVMATGKAFLTQAAVDEQIAGWERKVRRVPLNWLPASGGRPAQLSGRDLQRAPLSGGYSMGLALPALADNRREQVLLDQPGVWSLRLNKESRLVIRHGAVELSSAPLSLDQQCNSLIVSFNIRPEVTFPFLTSAAARTLVYLNGSVVLDSPLLLVGPRTESVLANPTTIGAAADGSQPLAVEITQPRLINKQLFAEQPGYGLADLQAELCATDNRNVSEVLAEIPAN